MGRRSNVSWFDLNIDSILHCQQLLRLKREINLKRPELSNTKSVVFPHENARPYIPLMNQEKLKNCCEVSMHPSYDPAFPIFEYHLCYSPRNHFIDLKLHQKRSVKIIRFTSPKSQTFCVVGAVVSSEKCQNLSFFYFNSEKISYNPLQMLA